ncbi:CU044_2847 family protein [Desulfobacterales bacterium HSG17]|nr:CU044_2847 family protein [Desulfobacterales bacterium HSG17]
MAEKQLIEFPIDDENSIFVEAEINEDDEGEMEVSRDGFAKKAAKNFQDSLATIKPIAETLVTKIGELSKKPQEVEVEFGLKMNAKAGAIIANSSIEGNIKVVLKWKQENLG